MIRQLKLEGTKVLKLYFDAKHNIRKCIRMLRWKDVAVERSGLGSAKSQNCWQCINNSHYISFFSTQELPQILLSFKRGRDWNLASNLVP
jgi:hypothetical protein